MSTEAMQENEPAGMECRNAREYALQRVEEEDGEILKSEDLAEEYSCSKSHMQTVLRELSKDGEIKRVGWGRYAAKSDDSEEEESEEPAGRADDLPSMDGGARSRDTDTTETHPADEGPVQCPAEGCEYEGFSYEGFQNHSNAVRSHGWEDIKDDLDRERLMDFERSEDLQAEDMVSQDELDLQRSRIEDGADEDAEEDADEQDADDLDDQDDEGDEEIVEEIEATTSKGIPLPVSSTVLIAAVVAGIALLWLYRRQSTQTETEPEQNQQEDDVFGGTGLVP